MTEPPSRQRKEASRSWGRRLRGKTLAWTSWQASEWACEHLAGDLGVAGLVGADEAELIAAEEGDEAVEQEEEGDGEEDDELPRGRRAQEAGGAAEPVEESAGWVGAGCGAARGGLWRVSHGAYG